jgi:thiol:disulfide interchange protein
MTRREILMAAVLQTANPRPEGDPVYDPKADPVLDVRKAVAQAAREKKNVFVEVGGEWCSWCHRMDKFFVDNPPLLELRRKGFVLARVNFSPENENKDFLSQFPAISGYPHIFILDSRAKLLVSQNTGDLEAGKSYDLEKFTEFLKEWSPKR